MTGRRAGVTAVALTVLSVGAMLVLVMFAARTGPQRIIHGTLVDPKFVRPIPTYSPLSPPPFGFGRGHGQFHQSHLLLWIGWVIKIALLCLAAWLVARGVMKLRQVIIDRRRPAPRPQAVDFDVLEDPDALVEEIRSDTDEQLALLLGGTPRNAIVACWDRFEEQAERVGLARRTWETSSEFTIRLLDHVSADGGAVARLELLYHEARFSEHPVGEEQRAAAVAALEAIHASLPVRAGR